MSGALSVEYEFGVFSKRDSSSSSSNTVMHSKDRAH